ncbi:GNAT family N-acetyltransferase [Bacillus sp. USDA818B3_A]|uniref:GNAT family N-acetyltransferase n=1 Tax=Bacillus sp. USDA818B3_A TaxID=2698834 RepID=UPI00136CAE77|nr:GNAT family N-acetyltransferase [Bacillus sp. USDA818B3_A]
MEVLVHKQIEVLDDIFPEWEMLIGNFYDITVFQDFSWLKSWWDFKNKQANITPYIIEIKDNNNPIGIIPLHILHIKFLKFKFRILKPIGSELSDYLVPILSNQYPAEELLDLAFSRIYKDKLSWDCIEWGDVPEDSHFAHFINNDRLGNYALIQRKKDHICPYLLLDKDAEKVKIKLGKEFLKKTLYKERRLNREGKFTYSKVTKEEDIEPILNKFFELHCQRWANTNTPSEYRHKDKRESLILTAKNLFKSNLLHLTYLTFDNEIIVVQFGMSDRKRIYLYVHSINIQYSKYSPGSILMYNIMLEGCREDYEILDFLRGDESYKNYWGTSEKMNQKFLFFNHSIRSLLYKDLIYLYETKQFKNVYKLKDYLKSHIGINHKVLKI